LENKNKTLFTVAVTVIITAFATFLTTTVFYIGVLNARPAPSITGGEKIFEVLEAIDEYFYFDTNDEKIADNMISSMVSSLGDEYTAYLSAEETQQFNDHLKGHYAGIGTLISWDETDNSLIILEVFENSPAEKSGIEAGDKITHIDGKDFSTLTFDEAVNRVLGEAGTEITATVIKKSDGTKKDIKITREDVRIPIIEKDMFEDNIGYIKLSSFDLESDEEFDAALSALENEGAKALILDLRNNGGGAVDSALKIAGSLLPKDTEIYYTINNKGKKVLYRSKGDGTELPIVLLVDENSASASEILAGALKESKKATLVGKTTFGKACAQILFPLSDGSSVKITTEKNFLPSGADVNGIGIVPDVEVELESINDEQLARAIEIAKEKI